MSTLKTKTLNWVASQIGGRATHAEIKKFMYETQHPGRTYDPTINRGWYCSYFSTSKYSEREPTLLTSQGTDPRYLTKNYPAGNHFTYGVVGTYPDGRKFVPEVDSSEKKAKTQKYDEFGNCIGYAKSEYDNICANCNCNKSIHETPPTISEEIVRITPDHEPKREIDPIVRWTLGYGTITEVEIDPRNIWEYPVQSHPETERAAKALYEKKYADRSIHAPEIFRLTRPTPDQEPEKVTPVTHEDIIGALRKEAAEETISKEDIAESKEIVEKSDAIYGVRGKVVVPSIEGFMKPGDVCYTMHQNKILDSWVEQTVITFTKLGWNVVYHVGGHQIRKHEDDVYTSKSALLESLTKN